VLAETDLSPEVMQLLVIVQSSDQQGVEPLLKLRER
jgi:hypothetical protein